MSIDHIVDSTPATLWSPYQERVFDFITNGRGDGVVDAVAGSGKTTTVIEGVNRTQSDSVLLCAFNKAIADELQERIGNGAVAKTLNAIGHGALMAHFNGRVKLNDHKYTDIIYTATEFAGEDETHTREMRAALKSLVSFAQSTLSNVDDEALDLLAAQYGIDIPDTKDYPLAYFYDTVRYVLNEGMRQAKEDRLISFNDQIWLPNVWDIKPKQYDWVFVDEAQDLSRAKLELVLRCRKRGGRMIFVGDPKQSIYGFAGADPKAWYEIIERTNATLLPLSVCYRCPTKHLDMVREIVPQIEAREDAPEGVLEYVDEDRVPTLVKDGDLILCRFTAPLIQMCLTLIRNRIPARVKGRDMAKMLTGMARDVIRGRSWDDFGPAVTEYVEAKTVLLKKRKNPGSAIQSLEDRAAGLLACYDAFDASNLNEFCRNIEDIFNDGQSSVELSTGHRAKGLQAKRVFILAPEVLGMARSKQQPWELEQEINLKYVVYTRSMSELYLVKMRPRTRSKSVEVSTM